MALGSLLQDKGDAAEAMTHYSEAVRLKPDFAEAHNKLGTTLADQGKTVEAVPHFVEAIRLKPDFPEALYNLALFEQELVDDRKFDPREAAASWQAYLKADPDPKSPWVEEFKSRYLSP